MANRLAASGRYVAVICLGAVIRGETTHDQHINRAVSAALCEIGVHYGLPVLFGILTCNTLDQAIARSGGQAATTGKDVTEASFGNKGVDCALAALEMVDLLQKTAGEIVGSRQWAVKSVESQAGRYSPNLQIPDPQPLAPSPSPMLRRSQAREVAFQVLYQDDLNPRNNPAEGDRFIERRLRADDMIAFARELVAGVRKTRAEVDARLEEIAANWSLKRMAATDRNVLRLGAYELLHTDTPPRVAVDEAVELAKRFGSAQSSQFVNGILDKVMHETEERTNDEIQMTKE